MALGEYFKDASFGAEPVEIAISQPGVPAAQRLKLDPRGFRTVGLNPGALLKNPVVKVEGQAGKTWLYKLELTAPRSGYRRRRGRQRLQGPPGHQ